MAFTYLEDTLLSRVFRLFPAFFRSVWSSRVVTSAEKFLDLIHRIDLVAFNRVAVRV